MKEDEVITKENIEKMIMKALKHYKKINHIFDEIFWRQAILLLGEKYGFLDKFNEELKKQINDDEELK